MDTPELVVKVNVQLTAVRLLMRGCPAAFSGQCADIRLPALCEREDFDRDCEKVLREAAQAATGCLATVTGSASFGAAIAWAVEEIDRLRRER